MLKRGTKVTLVGEGLPEPVEFDVEHATAILTSPHNQAETWKLPSQSKYTLHNGEIIRKPGAATAGEPKE